MGAMTLRLSIAMTPEDQARQDHYALERIADIIDNNRVTERKPMSYEAFQFMEGQHWRIKFYLGYLFSAGPELIDVVVRVAGGTVHLCSPAIPDLAFYPSDYDGGGLSENLNGDGGYTLMLPRPKGSTFSKDFWILFYPPRE